MRKYGDTRTEQLKTLKPEFNKPCGQISCHPERDKLVIGYLMGSDYAVDRVQTDALEKQDAEELNDKSREVIIMSFSTKVKSHV